MRHTPEIQQALSKRLPLIVAVIADKTGLASDFSTLTQCCDIIELRLDSLGWEKNVLEFARECPLPILITARGAAEGGINELSLTDRIAAYRTLMPYATLIDVEMRDFGQLAPIIEEAKEENILIVGSYHHFELTPEIDELLEKLTFPADVHKFALQIQQKEDLNTLLELLDIDTPVSVMGMGPIGAAARPLMGKAGSVLNYGFIGDSPTAPGQWPAALLKKTLAL